MQTSCIIIDDEKPAREELAFLLSDIKNIRIMDAVKSVSQAVQSIKKNNPDFIFLDIEMSGKSGFDILPDIREMDRPPLVVFVTAYDQHAVKAFEENAIDYILKPFSHKRLEQSLDRVMERLELNSTVARQQAHDALVETTSKLKKVKKISVERFGRMLLIDPADIVFCRYQDKKIMVHTRNEIFSIYGISTMDQLETNLKPFSFFRSHRSTIINFDYIREFSSWFNGKYILTMDDDKKTELTIPRNRVKSFKQMLGI